MVKACQRFRMALADVIFDATTRVPSVFAIFVCYCLYQIPVETSNSALFLEDDRSSLSEVAAELVNSEAESQNANTKGMPYFGCHTIGRSYTLKPNCSGAK